MPPRIVVTRWVPGPALDRLAAAGEMWLNPDDRALSREELHVAIAGADAVVAMLHDRVDEGFLEAAGPQLRVVANVAVGYDNADVPTCTARGVRFTNTPGVLTEATADIAFALILMATRRLAEGERLIRSQAPWNWNPRFMLGSGIQGKTLGVVGLGQIGTATARRGRAFGMNVVYAGRRRADPELERELEAHFLDLDELFATADVVSLHCPLTDHTRHLVTAERLGAMKPTAYLINTTRGPVIDEAALAAALREGVIAGAGLDVFENEPEVHPGLLGLDNVVMVPHVGSATRETREAMATLAAENAIAVLEGREPPTPVNDL